MIRYCPSQRSLICCQVPSARRRTRDGRRRGYALTAGVRGQEVAARHGAAELDVGDAFMDNVQAALAGSRVDLG